MLRLHRYNVASSKIFQGKGNETVVRPNVRFRDSEISRRKEDMIIIENQVGALTTINISGISMSATTIRRRRFQILDLFFDILNVKRMSIPIEIGCWMYTSERQAARLRLDFFKAVLSQDIGAFDTDLTTGKIIAGMTNHMNVIQDAIGKKGHGLGFRFFKGSSTSQWDFQAKIWLMQPDLIRGQCGHYPKGHFMIDVQQTYMGTESYGKETVSRVRYHDRHPGHYKDNFLQPGVTQKSVAQLQPGKRVLILTELDPKVKLWYFITLDGLGALRCLSFVYSALNYLLISLKRPKKGRRCNDKAGE
ncbi:hypothetical protein Syun_003958 [Stephania yunnanensis]|uniref:ABC transmembrane type-1 domain-containing protein n=1 Tax=Stephania yunnanensis TaxID=152371 RepID=A0AAP0L276_9MAGN